MMVRSVDDGNRHRSRISMSRPGAKKTRAACDQKMGYIVTIFAETKLFNCFDSELWRSFLEQTHPCRRTGKISANVE
jgi:hypothetical protein